MISNMAMALKSGSMEADMKEITIWGRKVEKGNMSGRTEVIMMATGWITRLLVKGNTFGQMDENTKGTGSTIKCMAVVNTNGKTGENIKVSINLTKSMGSASILGPMVADISASGPIVKGTAREKLSISTEVRKWVSGKMIKGLDG